MKLYFAKDELKEWVDNVLAFGLYKAIIENRNDLLSFLFFYCIAIFAQVMVLITAPVSFIILLLMATKIKRS